SAPGHRPRAEQHRRREQPSDPQEGRLPLARRPRHRAQEGWSEEGPQGSSVLEALIRSVPCMALFGTDGVRGLANGPLTAELALSLAQATAVVLGQGRIAEARRAAGKRLTAVVARDPRISGHFLSAAVEAGLASSGVDVLEAGTLPTPAAAFLISDIDADFGVMISASHNPAPDNGIKIFARGGVKLPDIVEQRIEATMTAGTKLQPTGGDVGRVLRFSDAEDRYVMHLLASLPHRLDGVHVVLDCANGAAS